MNVIYCHLSAPVPPYKCNGVAATPPPFIESENCSRACTGHVESLSILFWHTLWSVEVYLCCSNVALLLPGQVKRTVLIRFLKTLLLHMFLVGRRCHFCPFRWLQRLVLVSHLVKSVVSKGDSIIYWKEGGCSDFDQWNVITYHSLIALKT